MLLGQKLDLLVQQRPVSGFFAYRNDGDNES